MSGRDTGTLHGGRGRRERVKFAVCIMQENRGRARARPRSSCIMRGGAHKAEDILRAAWRRGGHISFPAGQFTLACTFCT